MTAVRALPVALPHVSATTGSAGSTGEAGMAGSASTTAAAAAAAVGVRGGHVDTAAGVGGSPTSELVRLPQASTSARGVEFHYSSCGCGSKPWNGDIVDWIWHPHWLASVAAVLRAGGLAEYPRLRIAYFIPHHNVTGGMKMIMQQIEKLHQRGHWVKAVYRGPPGTPVLPPWAPVAVDAQQLLGPSDPATMALTGVDVLIIGYFTQLLEFRDCIACPGPILYWEQGHEHVFGDPTGAEDWDRVFHEIAHLPIAYISVSTVIRDILKVHFARVAPVVPNAIDCEQFIITPDSGAAKATALLTGRNSDRTRVGAETTVSSAGVPPAETFLPASRRSQSGPPRRVPGPKKVLLVGNPVLRLKNFQTGLHALNIVHEHLVRSSRPDCKRGLEVTWICQVQPSVEGVAFPLHFVVNPPQHELPALFASGFDVLLFTSVYEAWGMPVLEAMAAGIPVVTSRCHGVDMFCKHGWNCFMAEPYDAAGLAMSVLKILQSPEIGDAFSRRGRRTAETLTWDASMRSLECALTQVYMCLGAGAAALRAAGILLPSLAVTPTERRLLAPAASQHVEYANIRAGQVFAPGIVRVWPAVTLPGHPRLEILLPPALLGAVHTPSVDGASGPIGSNLNGQRA